MKIKNITIGLILFIFPVSALNAQVDNKFFGVALAGGEWGVFPTNSNLDYIASKGIYFVRTQGETKKLITQ